MLSKRGARAAKPNVDWISRPSSERIEGANRGAAPAWYDLGFDATHLCFSLAHAWGTRPARGAAHCWRMAPALCVMSVTAGVGYVEKILLQGRRGGYRSKMTQEQLAGLGLTEGGCNRTGTGQPR